MLGLGDRHNENIMITEKDTCVFHIDFGYVAGEDPKPHYLNPTLKLRDDMLQPLGSHGQKLRKHFSELASLTYRILRRHNPLFYTMLMEITTCKPPIDNVNPENHKAELATRTLR